MSESEQTLLQALAHHRAGEFQEAERLYRVVLQTQPNHGDVNHNLGVLLIQAGKSQTGLSYLKAAVEANPAQGQYWLSYAEELLASGNPRDALAVIDEGKRRGLQGAAVDALRERIAASLRSGPGQEEMDDVVGLFSASRYAEAESAARQMIQLWPHHGFGWKVLGALLSDQQRFEEALPIHQKAVTLLPSDPETHNNLGNTLHGLDRMSEAEASYRRALELNPDYPEAHSNLGNALQALGRLSEAEASCRRALTLKPNYPEAYNNLGNALQDLGRLSEAEASYRRALELKSNFHEAHSNLGNVLQALSRFSDAEASYRRALTLKPDFHEAHNNLGNSLKVLGRLAEAELSFRRACELKPDWAIAYQSLSTIRGFQSDFSEVKMLSDTALKLLSSSKKDRYSVWENRLYILSYHPDLSVEEIFSDFVRWGDMQDCSGATRPHANDRSSGRKLRVGYVSPDFRRHTSRFFFEPLFAHHDRNCVELFAYCNVKQADDYTERFKTLFDHWRDISSMPDDAAEELVRRDGIDILVDGCNHMRDERLGLFARRPAPVQVTWIGSAWTSGLPTMDYVLFDPYVAPAGTLAREAIVRLPRTFAAYRPPEDTAPIVAAPCLRNGYITFGYFGRTERLNHRVFRLWGQILAALPQTRLILDFRPFGDSATRDYYAGFLTKHGVDMARVTMRHSENVWQALNDIDIMLDSFPHSGGTMNYDSIWMGVPVLTLAARPPLGRIGTGIMTSLGLSEWVAANEQSYLAKAVSLSQNGKALAKLRRGLRNRIAVSPLQDEEGFARCVERAYREMWQRWCTNTPAAPFDITLDLKILQRKEV